MRRVKEEEKERLRRHRGRVEKTLEIANGVTPSVATLTNKFNERKEMVNGEIEGFIDKIYIADGMY